MLLKLVQVARYLLFKDQVLLWHQQEQYQPIQQLQKLLVQYLA
jgi:hypothetical protein